MMLLRLLLTLALYEYMNRRSQRRLEVKRKMCVRNTGEMQKCWLDNLCRYHSAIRTAVVRVRAANLSSDRELRGTWIQSHFLLLGKCLQRGEKKIIKSKMLMAVLSVTSKLWQEWKSPSISEISKEPWASTQCTLVCWSKNGDYRWSRDLVKYLQ